MKTRKPQDSEREEKLIHLCKLKVGCTNRIGIDAYDENNDAYELKSTTKNGVSTARDVGLAHLDKWRNRNWICGKGSYNHTDDFCFEEIYFLRPASLEVWFSQIERKLRSKEPLFQKLLLLMTESGRFEDCEFEDIRYVFRRGVLMNDPNIPWRLVKEQGINITEDPDRMLREILQTTGSLTNTVSGPDHKARLPTFLFEIEQDL